ncbi:MAG TPA: HupE/UreJ family protein [Myxococcota bacterium]|jgi:hydrogenase/urease accessory protein HupE
MRRRLARALGPGLAALLGAFALVAPAGAHPLAPSLLELRERSDGVVAVRFRMPRIQRNGAALLPELPPACRALGAPELETDASSATLRWLVECGPEGLRGGALRVHGLREAGTDALLRAELADGVLVRAVLRPGADTYTIPRRAPRLGVAADYLAMGFGHLLGGLDHLLFVLGLVLLVRGPRRLLAAVTGFTLGHSVTLSLAALGLIRVPVGLVEVGIAASLFWLATRLAQPGPAGERLPHAWRTPALFGLLHGLGFAGALAQAGLPAGEIPLALFAFNLGIELGQLAVVAALLALRAGLRPWSARTPAWLARAPAYAIGTTAAALILERVAAGLA